MSGPGDRKGEMVRYGDIFDHTGGEGMTFEELVDGLSGDDELAKLKDRENAAYRLLVDYAEKMISESSNQEVVEAALVVLNALGGQRTPR